MDADGGQLGACPTDGGQTQFTVWAPQVRRVDVRLESNPPRIVPLDSIAGGYFTALVALAGPGTRYYYRLDDRIERPDPASRFQPDGVHGPSAVVDSNFDWHDAGWRGLELGNPSHL